MINNQDRGIVREKIWTEQHNFARVKGSLIHGNTSEVFMEIKKKTYQIISIFLLMITDSVYNSFRYNKSTQF